MLGCARNTYIQPFSRRCLFHTSVFFERISWKGCVGFTFHFLFCLPQDIFSLVLKYPENHMKKAAFLNVQNWQTKKLFVG